MKKTFTVPNISCGHCVNTIKNELSEEEAVLRVEGDAETKQITVEWSSPFSEKSIRKILETINYPAE